MADPVTPAPTEPTIAPRELAPGEMLEAAPLPEGVTAFEISAAPVRSVEHWRAVKRTPEWLFRAACARERWEYGTQVVPTEVTEERYDAVIDQVAHARL